MYFSIMPKADGFDERMRIFKLYHLLNHLNLHGAGFGSGGSSEEPQGYLEKVVNCMLDITGDSSRKGLK
jgi:Fructosamine kinase